MYVFTTSTDTKNLAVTHLRLLLRANKNRFRAEQFGEQVSAFPDERSRSSKLMTDISDSTDVCLSVRRSGGAML